MRSQLHDLLGHVVSARISLDALRIEIVTLLRSDETPSYRGHAFTKEHYDALEGVSYSLEAAFNFLKGCQFTETLPSRSEEAHSFLARLPVTATESPLEATEHSS